jgi:poly(hydroxyalkanoate) granule-associated protein
MVTKIQKKAPPQTAGAPLSSTVKDSAQQIWQAGLGAFTRAQAEGSKAFESLVKEGVNIQRKTQSVAEERLAEATNKMSTMATDITSKASGQWDKLENIFEDRVAKALSKLGVPSAKDVNALIARIDELNLAVQKLSGNAPARRTAVKTASVASDKATAAKKTVATKVARKATPKAKAAATTKQP